ncbi:hypothetical protein [Polymorphobacter sp.]|uniref:hypothetical protein n=1 Tax=Polymorphobacter sp. TaxID=1909290 RepID=UPI003F6FF4A4
MANAVTRTTDGVAVHNVFKDPLARTVHVRRDTSGVVERHEAFNDVMIATKGSVTLLLGGRIEGGAETEPGEWRGGTIVGGRQQLFKAGDMLWIPAGVPHQMLVTKGSSFTYSVVKTAR